MSNKIPLCFNRSLPCDFSWNMVEEVWNSQWPDIDWNTFTLKGQEPCFQMGNLIPKGSEVWIYHLNPSWYEKIWLVWQLMCVALCLPNVSLKNIDSECDAAYLCKVQRSKAEWYEVYTCRFTIPYPEPLGQMCLCIQEISFRKVIWCT